MPTMECRTKGNASPKGKPRVYFTCHPEDLDLYFDKICEDIFASRDCAIYYTPDLRAPIEDADKATDLGTHNLFVLPVTYRLLTEDCRAMRTDLAYAKAEHIPILPFMMESGLDALYARPENFGELQYLNPFSTDATEIPYEEKLEKYLAATLVSDETARRVRAAFDAYIFLSYRKKDRRYANELMRLIHAKPEYRDIAIWYDEFLTPGESFRENIERALRDSRLFALLVTPSILEEPGGRPNFVMGEEYPAARDAGMDIVPARMADTDEVLLSEKFKDIPLPVDPHNDAALGARLSATLESVARRENDRDPEHNFLIGLAYLEGIDVETDRERGVAIIRAAAEAGLCEAMEKLFDMYREGVGVALDWREALRYSKMLYERRVERLGETHADTLRALNDLAVAYGLAGDYENEIACGERVLALRTELLGASAPLTITAMNNLSVAYGKCGNTEKQLELAERAYGMRLAALGASHPQVLTSMNNLALAYNGAGRNEEALALYEKVYEVRRREFGEEHASTLIVLNNIAYTCGKLAQYDKQLALYTRVWEARRDTLGALHPETLTSLHGMAASMSELGDKAGALAQYERAYEGRRAVLGETHPDTLDSRSSMATLLCATRRYAEARDHFLAVLGARRARLGETHEDTVRTRLSLAACYLGLGDGENAIDTAKEAVATAVEAFGMDSRYTKHAYEYLCQAHNASGDPESAVGAALDYVEAAEQALGEAHPMTVDAYETLASYCFETEDKTRAIPFIEHVYAARCEMYGDTDARCIDTLARLVVIYQKCGEIGKMAEVMLTTVDVYRRAYGEGDPRTVRMEQIVAAYREKLPFLFE